MNINNKKIEDELEYKILNPGGNVTALVKEKNYTTKEKIYINDYILTNNSNVEQVGFLNKKDNILNMAGGEFCVNATRCAIYELLEGKKGQTQISVSGCKDKITGRVLDNNNVCVYMNLNKNISEFTQNIGKNRLIDLDGISLYVLDENDSKEKISYLKQCGFNDEARTYFKNMMKDIKTSNNAVGVILLEKENDKYKINPIIWVKTIDTLYYETACGSGSLATAIYLYMTKKVKKVEILQPSGYSINIKLEIDEYNNKLINSCFIQGYVDYVQK